MNFVGITCVKNEARWIERVLAAQHFCERIIVMDDHSTDDTVRIAERFHNVMVVPSPFPDYHEGRNNEYLVELAAYFNPTWIVHCMGDEVIEPLAWSKIHYLAQNQSTTVMRFDVVNYWDGDKIRIDGSWAKRKAHTIWRFPAGQKLTYYAMHCGLPEQVECNTHPHPDEPQALPLTLYHYGYSSPELRRQAYDFFMERDFHPQRRDGYAALLDEPPVAVLI